MNVLPNKRHDGANAMMKYEDKLIAIMLTRPNLMQDLKLVQSLQLRDWYIAAGYVRNYVWDYLHQYASLTPLNDVDVIYHDTSDQSEAIEKQYENQLKASEPRYKWSVKNQARMHHKHRTAPYASIEDAIKRWPETATAVGVTLDEDDQVRIVAPLGLEDLFHLVIRQSPFFGDTAFYSARVQSKNWLQAWPRLQRVD